MSPFGYTLLKQRYGVNATDLINMAPLFFTLLVEGSLAWRREQLEAAEEAMWRASALGNGHLACMNAVHHAEKGLSRERRSIEALDPRMRICPTCFHPTTVGPETTRE